MWEIVTSLAGSPFGLFVIGITIGSMVVAALEVRKP